VLNQKIVAMNNDRFAELLHKFNNKVATRKETDELIEMMHKAGKLSDWQYERYQRNWKEKQLMTAVLTIGFILLAGIVITQLANQK